MKNLTLRFANHHDAGLMLAIYVSKIGSAGTKECGVPTRLEFTQQMEKDMKDGFPWVVAERDGALLGYAFARRFEERYGFEWAVELSAYLASDADTFRIQEILYAAILNVLYQQGYCSCYALVTTQNSLEVEFYKDYGFKEVARLPYACYKQGNWWELSYFHLKLRPYVASPVPPVPFYQLDPDIMKKIFCRAADLEQASRES